MTQEVPPELGGRPSLSRVREEVWELNGLGIAKSEKSIVPRQTLAEKERSQNDLVDTER